MVSQNAFLDWVSKKEDVRLVTEVLSELESYCEQRGLFKINLLDSTDPVALCFMESIAGSNEYEAKYPQSQAFKVLSLYKEYLDEKSYLRNAKWWKKEVVKCYKSGLCLLFWKEDEDWIDSEPKKFFYKSKAITVSSWKALYNNICNSLYDDYPEIFSGIAGKSFLPDCAPDIVSKKDIKLLKKLGKVGGSLYLELGLSTKEIVERIFALLNLCHVSPLDLPILYVSNLKDKTSYVADNVAEDKENNVVTVLKEESVAVTDIEAEPSLKQQNASHVISTSAEKAKNDVKELRLFGLESGETPSSVQPVMFSLQDSSNIDVKDWKDMYLKFARQVCSVYPEIKKNMMEHDFAVSSSIGFIDNKLDDNFFLATDISEEEILRRIKVILIKFVDIPCSDLWIWCSRASKSQVLISSNPQKNIGPCELEVDFCSERDMDRTLPISCEFSGQEVKQFTNWNQLYLYVIKTLHSWKSHILKEYVGKSLVGESSPDITDRGSKSGNALFISDNLYLEINQRITGKIKRIHALLDLYEAAYSTLTIKYSDIPFTPKISRKENIVNKAKSDSAKKTSCCESEKSLNNALADNIPAGPLAHIAENVLIDFSADVDLTSTKPSSLVIFGNEHKVIGHWNMLYVEAIRALYERFPEKIMGLRGKSLTGTGLVDLADEEGVEDMGAPYFITTDMYLDAQNTPAEKIKTLGCLLEICKVNSKDFQIWYSHMVKGASEIVMARLSQVQTKQVEDNLKTLIINQFAKGIRNDKIGINKLRKAYANANNGEALETDFDLQAFLDSNCIYCKGTYYFLSEDMADKITKMMEKLVNEGNKLFYYQELYHSYNDFFILMHIYSSDLLKAILKKIFDKYEFRIDYFTTERATDLYSELVRCFNNQACLSYTQLSEALPYVPEQIIKDEVSNNKCFINVRNKEFALERNIITDNAEGESFLKDVRKVVSEKGYARITDFSFPVGLELNPELTDSALRVVYFRRYLSTWYDKKNNSIYPKGESQNNTTLYRRLCNSSKTLSRAELNDYERSKSGESRDVAYKIACEEMVRIDKDNFISKDSVNFDVDAIDSVLDSVSNGKVTSLMKIKKFYLFNNTDYPWNHYLLESYCRHFSKRYSFGSLTINDNKVGAIYPGRQKREYVDVLTEAVKDAGISLNDIVVGDFLVEQGYINKRSKIVTDVTLRAQRK